MAAPGVPGKKKKVWKGEKRSGPAPARHIPWPEIFKHHISVVEGHMKMVEMVQKHTVEGTGNFETITNLVKRSHEMLRQAKDISRTFVPPKNQREMVPLGSSSESMYPGYSPADIEYGKAAGEFGQTLGELKAQGVNVEMPANGPEYKVGQAHGTKRKLLFKKERTQSTGSEGVTKNPSEEPGFANDEERGENPYFVIDTNPTPVVLPGDSKKRPLENGSETEKAEKKDRKKKKSKDETQPVIETEDISAEVHARLKAKEKKKRKRESIGDGEKEVKKSKKEKSKRHAVEEGEEDSGDVEGKRKKKKKSTVAE